MVKEPVQPQDKYVVRMPDGLRDRIKRAADISGKSMNAEIVSALEEKFPAPPLEVELRKTLGDLLSRLENAAPDQREQIKTALAPIYKQIGGVFE